jgi:hypothetical protein
MNRMASKKPPREHPERPIIKMLLSAYENDGWQSAKLHWPEDTGENAVEVVATKSDGTTLALEHTLIEPFVGEKYDSVVFTEAFVDKIEKNPDLVIPERTLNVSIPVGALPKGYDWKEVGEEVLAWLKANHASAPEGVSKHVVMVGASSKKELLPLTVSLRVECLPGMDGYCLLSRDSVPKTLSEVVTKALKNKLPKLVRTEAKRRILLLEREHISLGDGVIVEEIKKQAANFPELEKVDEIWHVNTSILASEGWTYFTLMDRSGSLIEILRFQNGVFEHRRRDTPY